MRALIAATVVATIFGVASCGSHPLMPDVTGQKLDQAKTAIKAAGYNDDIKVDGGGIFGIFKESNWEVCKQTPKSGTSFTTKPKLSVKRSCTKAKPEPTATATATPSATPTPTQKPTSPKTAEPVDDKTLTVKNSPELAALLNIQDECDSKIGKFAKKFAGRTIRFNGSVVNVAPYGITVASGNKGPNTVRGVIFKVDDTDWSEGDLVKVEAEVGEFNDFQCLFSLDIADLTAR